jgi:hypothetical protein
VIHGELLQKRIEGHLMAQRLGMIGMVKREVIERHSTNDAIRGFKEYSVSSNTMPTIGSQDNA